MSSPDRDRLIDFLLDEVSGEEAYAVEERLATDSEYAGELERYREALSVLRVAADAEWPVARRRLRLLKPALAAAAVLVVAVSIFFVNGGPAGPSRRFLPDAAYGYLRPEETDARGGVPIPSAVEVTTLREGRCDIAVFGSQRSYPVEPGEEIPSDSEISSHADAGVRIDLPHGGILFMAPVSTVRLRKRADGRSALRLTNGAAATVAGSRTIHLAVDGTDLLLEQSAGAALLRRSPAEVVNLRGDMVLTYDGDKRFPVPAGERLPAACTNDPRTVVVTDDELDLDWYRELVYASCRVERIVWERPGVSRALRTGPATMLYLRLAPRGAGEVTVRFGGRTRQYDVRRGDELELRLKASELGPGPRLAVAPADAVREARLFEAVPR